MDSYIRYCRQSGFSNYIREWGSNGTGAIRLCMYYQVGRWDISIQICCMLRLSMMQRTGQPALAWFRRSASRQAQSRLLLCPESCDPVIADEEADRILCLSRDNFALLHDWLKQNAAIIPISTGGLASPCHCPEPDNPASDHLKGCIHGWFNKNASR